MSIAYKTENNDYIDSSCIVHERMLLNEFIRNLTRQKSYYIETYAGLLVKLNDSRMFKMITVKIIGNGYSSNPIDTIIQTYHYTPLGNFIECKQHNNSGSLPACKFFVRNGFIHLWIPKVANFCSYTVEIYETNAVNREVYYDGYLDNNIPAEIGVTCTIV